MLLDGSFIEINYVNRQIALLWDHLSWKVLLTSLINSTHLKRSSELKWILQIISFQFFVDLFFIKLERNMCICFLNINNRKVGQVCLIIRNFTKLNLLKLYSVPQSSGLKARYSWSFQPESIAEFSWCLCGQIDVKNPNKVTLLNGASLFSKNKKKCMEPYCARLLGVVHLESNREMKPKWFQWRLWLMFCIMLLCSLPHKCASRCQALYKWLVNLGVYTIHKNGVHVK